MLDRLDPTPWLSHQNMTDAHLILSFIGVFLAVYLMQVKWIDAEDKLDPVWLQHSRRLALVVIALGLLWGVSFQDTKGWQPWAPDVIVIAGFDLSMLLRAITILRRTHEHENNRRIPHRERGILR